MLTYDILEPRNDHAIDNAVILLHGLGDSGAGLIGLGQEWQNALPKTVFYAPNAPEACDMAPFGYQWFSAQDWTPSVVLEGIKKSSTALNGFIDYVIQRHALPAQKVALVGFSQGSMMSLYVAPRRDETLAGVVAYSGALVGGETLAEEKKSAPPVLLIHGMMDDVVPFAAMSQAERGLKYAKIPATAIPCPNLAHSIDRIGLIEGSNFLKKALHTSA